MRDRSVERLNGLAGEVAAAHVDRGEGHQHRDAPALLLEHGLDSVQRRLRVQRIEYGLDQQDVDAAVEQSSHRVRVRIHHLVERDAAVPGIVDIRGDGQRPVCRPNAASDELGLVRTPVRVLVRDLPRQTCRLSVDLVDMRFESELRQPEARGRKCIGRQDVRAGIQVLGLRPLDQAGLRQHQDIDAAPKFPVVVDEPLPPEFALSQPQRLKHYAPGPIHHHDPPPEDALDPRGTVYDVVRYGRGCCHDLGPGLEYVSPL